MSDNTMKSFLEEYDVKRINKGQILKGKVLEVNEKEAVVNINYAFDGLIAKEEVSIDDKNPMDVLSVDDEIDVYVISPNDGEGYVKLSLIKALVIKEKEQLQKAFKEEKNVKVYVKDEIKGGLISYYGNIRVFIPASLASRNMIDLSALKNTELEVRIIELDFRNNKVVASRKAIENEEYEKNRKVIWNSLKEGEKRTGVVKKLVKYGAFVDIGGVEGLVHISDLSWNRVNRPEEVVKENDKVEVYIGSIDVEKQKLSLVLKDINKEPWTLHTNEIKSGMIFEGKVVKFASFGAFVEIFEGIEGLVHISEITDENIAKPSDALELNQKVKVKVLDFNKDTKRLSLSIKDAVETSKEYLQYVDEEDGVSLGELFKNFKFE
ncbi:30S ribosomal protein S1 [Clostridium botulinum]|uniref:30S ribosomal protein S1 homolog n=2 Tax=Clostridium TaxID=1485 RepID=B2TK49_CLOBB|nr:30S ribosomal protein S1 [Clostridium sp. ZBS4]ACD22484.1 putative 30S ribosomal protein S1 homolog [Clostridium botulinum B str. Eklund 17B (NRP)]MBY6976434.1 30S ribosomal protein S1 [Clostridium botulinum]MBY7001634.1 30S ribosomal protein S1 [Clostridium botulinum]MCR1274468.1 30S ribosomal protein S1 [Clostridium botulinum]NFD69146.1 30S ribosomal protein S1 [Clostridium botulinum]